MRCSHRSTNLGADGGCIRSPNDGVWRIDAAGSLGKLSSRMEKIEQGQKETDDYDSGPEDIYLMITEVERDEEAEMRRKSTAEIRRMG